MDLLSLTRQESVTVARLRTDHSLSLRSYRQRICLDHAATCQEWDDEKDETLHHLVTQHSARAVLHRDMFGCEDTTLWQALAVFLRGWEASDDMSMAGIFVSITNWQRAHKTFLFPTNSEFLD